MPTYEYVCTKCGHEFEVFQSITDKPLTICPKNHCARNRWGRGRVKRKIGAGAGLLFKGSGFYITDYRSESYKQAAKRESGTPAPATTQAGAEKKSAADKSATGSQSAKADKAGS